MGLPLLLALSVILTAAEPPAHCTPPVAGNNDQNEVFQYFLQGQGRANLEAWLWIPPGTTTIRAVMVGMHNGLPLPILQHPAIRAVCARHGIAQVLMTPWSEDIGKVVKDLTFDFTDPNEPPFSMATLPVWRI